MDPQKARSCLRRPITASTSLANSRLISPTKKSTSPHFQPRSSLLSDLLTVQSVSRRCKRTYPAKLQDPHAIDEAVLGHCLGHLREMLPETDLPLPSGKFSNELLQTFTLDAVPKRLTHRLRRRSRKNTVPALSIKKIPPFSPKIDTNVRARLKQPFLRLPYKSKAV